MLSLKKVGVKQEESISSSIGKNSDGEDSGEKEVQSTYNKDGTVLDTMEALEEVLPVWRGISRFYNGKSKSFNNLSDAVSSNIRDLVKPEKPYNRKRKRLLALAFRRTARMRTRDQEDFSNARNSSSSSPRFLDDETLPLLPQPGQS
ncbi:uncharacterized protein LOC122651097 [Telopea speciosissima]|uniref:uncharacterized protein LOC122651097 n=1 Tax=Telopea speciosissima TaxID=54955 RepID=UPI001CC3369B|nr:uncharacterized protein LOC122651097 [Telopea speciosissima]